MSIVFNSPDHVQERANVEPLHTIELEVLVMLFNKSFDDSPIILQAIQRLVWEYENLKHASMTAPKWISVNDALPNPYERVPILDNKTKDIGFIDDDKQWFIKSKYGTDETSAVTHWMPLPTPPNTK